MLYNTLNNFSSTGFKSDRTNKIDTVVFFICVIDILFLPYIRFLSVSLSMLLLPLWYLLNFKKINIDKEFKFFLISIALIFLSLLVSMTTFPNALYFKDNLVNSVIILYGFLYYFFFKKYFKKTNFSIDKLLKSFLFFGLFLAIIYIINPQFYFQLRSFWTLSGEVISVDNSLLIHRFTNTFSDPNNASVAFVGILSYLLLNTKTKLIESLILITSTLVILSVTMSSTGFISFGLIITYFIFRIIRTKKILIIDRRNLFFLSFLIILLPVIFIVIYNFIKSDISQLALNRINDNSADSRIIIWKELLLKESLLKYPLFGMGGTLIIDGLPFRPHNGHFHLIYNYGLVVYITFLSIFFRKRKENTFQSYFFLVPFLLGFTVNVGIYEPRFTFILALLCGSYASNKCFRK